MYNHSYRKHYVQTLFLPIIFLWRHSAFESLQFLNLPLEDLFKWRAYHLLRLLFDFTDFRILDWLVRISGWDLEQIRRHGAGEDWNNERRGSLLKRLILAEFEERFFITLCDLRLELFNWVIGNEFMVLFKFKKAFDYDFILNRVAQLLLELERDCWIQRIHLY